jgi:hypothetical protein
MHQRAASLIVIASVAIAAVGIAQTWQAPIRRAGYWEQTVAMTGARARTMTTHYCTDTAMEKQFSAFGQGPNARMCSQREMHRTATGMAFNSVCTMGGRTMTTSGVATGDFQTHFHIETTMHSTPPMPGMGEQTVSMDGKWLGPCPPGRKPGDMVMEGGQVVNIGAMTPH